jgi:hypothetical protein
VATGGRTGGPSAAQRKRGAAGRVSPASSVGGAARAKRDGNIPAPPPAAPDTAPGTAPSATGRRRTSAWLVALPLLGALSLGGTAYGANELTGPRYAAEALLTVLPTAPSAPVSQPIAGIWVQVGRSDAVLADAAAALDVDDEELASRLTLVPASDSPVIAVRVSTSDAQRSAEWANTVAGVLLDQDRTAPVPGYELEQVTEAVPPGTGAGPVSPPAMVAAALFGALAGFVLAQWFRRIRRPAAA